MNEKPTNDAEANSAGSPGKIAGSAPPTAQPIEPQSIGLRTPIRSARRPTGMPRNIGNSANNAISRPTTAGDAPRDSASSDTEMRVPDNTMWLHIPSAISAASVGDRDHARNFTARGG